MKDTFLKERWYLYLYLVHVVATSASRRTCASCAHVGSVVTPVLGRQGSQCAIESLPETTSNRYGSIAISPVSQCQAVD